MKDDMKYGIYMKELCCEDCDYAGGEMKMGFGPPMPVSICPDCGGELAEFIGRWKYTETKVPWWGYFFVGYDSETIYHGFEKGRVVKKIKNLSKTTINNSLNAAQKKVPEEFRKEFNDYCAAVMGYEKDMVDADGDVYDPYYNLHQCAGVIGELINLTGRHPEASIHDANSSTWSTWHDFVISTMPEHE